MATRTEIEAAYRKALAAEEAAGRPDPGTTLKSPTLRKGVVTASSPFQIDDLPASNVTGGPLDVGDVVWMLVDAGRRLAVGPTRVARGLELLAHEQVTTTTQSEVEWTNISQDYDNLLIEWQAWSDASEPRLEMQFNGNVGASDYYRQTIRFEGSGPTTAIYQGNANSIVLGRLTAFTGGGFVRIPGYSKGSARKGPTGASWAAGYSHLIGGRYNLSAVITSVRVYLLTDNFSPAAAGSQFWLYGERGA